MGHLSFIMSKIKLCFFTNASFIAVKAKIQIGLKWHKMRILGLKRQKVLGRYPHTPPTPMPPSGRGHPMSHAYPELGLRGNKWFLFFTFCPCYLKP